MAKQTVTFVVDTERDRDILRWLGMQDNKSASIREAIRAHLGRGAVTLSDVYEAIQELKGRGWVPVEQYTPAHPLDHDEPPDVAAALDSLGL
ncbi:MAG: hypothetical protein JXA93_21530 [Anaerolineae bacterium]|nr:hypothetical protein [Anaerolineae bacterium]